MKKDKKALKFKTIFFVTLGSFFLAAAFSIFFIPNEIAPGGVSGFATLLNALLGWNVSLLVLILNVPLFLGGWRKHGFRFMMLSLFSTILLSLFIEVIKMPVEWVKMVQEDMLLSSIFGGALAGLGLGLVIREGATTGGTDLLAMIINDKFPNIGVAWVLFAIDFLVVTAAVVLLSPLAGLYALVALFVSSKVLDFVQTGMDSAKAFMIVSNRSQDITQAIMTKIERGVTLLDGHGGFSRTHKEVVLCVVSRTQIAKLRSVIKDIDENAFVMMYDVKEVEGEGFTK
ncbi:MAG: YitT family protein [Clostridia bacterium]|nr:YitT family protein [Clostridia bacterium]